MLDWTNWLLVSALFFVFALLIWLLEPRGKD